MSLIIKMQILVVNEDQPPPPPPPVYDISHLPHDPGERQHILNYPINNQDVIQRVYIVKGQINSIASFLYSFMSLF
jgi:hypothetical protein